MLTSVSGWASGIDIVGRRGGTTSVPYGRRGGTTSVPYGTRPLAQLYFGSRTDPVARIAMPFKKPKDIYKTCVWGDFQTFDCLNGRETIAGAS